MSGPASDKPPAFCANCIEESTPLTRCISKLARRGRTVWLCAACLDPVGALRIHDVMDREATGKPGATGTRTDGNSRRGARK